MYRKLCVLGTIDWRKLSYRNRGLRNEPGSKQSMDCGSSMQIFLNPKVEFTLF